MKVLVSFYKERGQIVKQSYDFVQIAEKAILGRSEDIDLPEEPSTWDADTPVSPILRKRATE